jgi:hypothetical protein
MHYEIPATRAHSADVIIGSEPGKGSCFTLSLPLIQSDILPVENEPSTDIGKHSSLSGERK